MRGDWKDEAMQYRDVDRAAQKKAEDTMNQTATQTRASETPRTDAVIAANPSGGTAAINAQAFGLAQLARTLERELQSAREGFAKASAALAEPQS